MKLLMYLSQLMIPLFMFYIIAYGILCRRNIYEDFTEGAKEGLKTIVKMMPTLIGLMTAVGVLRASGFLEFLSHVLTPAARMINMPAQLVPVAVVRLFSSSAATGLLIDIFKKFGTDSQAGFMGAVMLSATESLFYCVSLYCGYIGLKKTRYLIPGALLATAAGIAASIIITGALF